MSGRDLKCFVVSGNLARILMVRRESVHATPMITPTSRNHATARIPFSRLQVTQPRPDTPGEGCVLGGVPGVLPGVPPCAWPALSPCIGTVWVLLHGGPLLSVPVNSTRSV